ncbi:hypothetical protein [Pasteurella sp. PK-2025]|uniref:hypothetical protein n=1 Tax=Pasteurella sp. PK-2025 TaxID=3413133 RepID=UPI003C747168
MKKVIALTAILALSVTAISEAKGARGGRSSGASRPVASKPALPARQSAATQQTQKNTQQQPDATFNQQIQQNATKAPANTGNRLASFATGAAAGYLLSEALTPNEAQAQTATPKADATAGQALNTPTSHAHTIHFRSFDAKNPALVGLAGVQSLYCLNGGLYLMSSSNNQLIAVTDNKQQPLPCNIAP